LQTHADLVKSLFLAAFEADEPFPQVLNAALTRVYEEHGWDLVLGEPATPGVVPAYPALGDLQAADAAVRAAAYGPEVERNVRGFIAVRIGSLRLGTPGGSSTAATSWTSAPCWSGTWCSRSRTSVMTRTRRS
jgi:hypothetical protein